MNELVQKLLDLHALCCQAADVNRRLHAEIERLRAAAPPQAAQPLTQAAADVRPVAGEIREPINGSGWRAVWWNESLRAMLPDDMRLDRFNVYRNGTIQLTFKKGDAAMAAQPKGEA